jgi:hypothetical protein
MRRDQPVEFLEKDLGAETFAGLGELNHFYFYLTTEDTEVHRAVVKQGSD